MASLRQLHFPEYTVAVEVDEEKCVGPFECGKCLKNCPAAVFRTYPRKRVKGEICKDWGVEAANDAFCWGCGVCTKICPTKAITIASEK
jgi:NAD-dependent dihydropyrimidine dehydrogenase PreA subunit